MREYTTPTETLFIPDQSLADATQVFVTFSNACRKKSVTISDNLTIEVDERGTTIQAELTQEQTAMFKPRDPIDVQVNWITGSGKRVATEIVSIPCWENLIKEVIE